MPDTKDDTEYARRGRTAKVMEMVQAVHTARGQHHPPPSWAHTADKLDAYTADQWRTLSVAAGRPDRVPSAATQQGVRAAVRTLAIAEALPGSGDPFKGLPGHG